EGLGGRHPEARRRAPLAVRTQLCAGGLGAGLPQSRSGPRPLRPFQYPRPPRLLVHARSAELLKMVGHALACQPAGGRPCFPLPPTHRQTRTTRRPISLPARSSTSLGSARCISSKSRSEERRVGKEGTSRGGAH